MPQNIGSLQKRSLSVEKTASTYNSYNQVIPNNEIDHFERPLVKQQTMKHKK
jgi:hypothetical protein